MLSQLSAVPQLLHPVGAPRSLQLGSGGNWTAEDFVGCTKICFVEGKEGHVLLRVTVWGLGLMDKHM